MLKGEIFGSLSVVFDGEGELAVLFVDFGDSFLYFGDIRNSVVLNVEGDGHFQELDALCVMKDKYLQCWSFILNWLPRRSIQPTARPCKCDRTLHITCTP